MRSIIISGYANQLITAITGIVLVPIYLRYLGVQDYGIVTITTSIVAAFTLLDMGFTPLLTKAFARIDTQRKEKLAFGYLCLLEIYFFFGTALVSFILLIFIFIFTDISVQVLFTEYSYCFPLIISIFLRLLESLYRATLIGQNRQLLANIISIMSTVGKATLTITLLELWHPRLEQYFLGQLFAQFMILLVARNKIRQTFSRTYILEISTFHLRRNKEFIWSLFIINGVGFVLTKLDRPVLALFRDLEHVTIYGLSATYASVLNFVMIPLLQYFYRQFCTIEDSIEKQKTLVHAQRFSLMFLCGCFALLFIHVKDFINLWLGNDNEIYFEVIQISRFLLVATFFNSLSQIPYQFILSGDNLHRLRFLNLCSAPIFLGMIMIAASLYGVYGILLSIFTLNLSLLFGMYYYVLSETKHNLKLKIFIFDPTIYLIIYFISSYILKKLCSVFGYVDFHNLIIVYILFFGLLYTGVMRYVIDIKR